MSAENVSGSGSSQGVSAVGAYQSLAEETRGLKDSDLVHITLDVVAAVTTAFGVLPKLATLREPIQQLPGFDRAAVDKLETYAMALYETHADYLSASRPTESLPKLVEEATKVRDQLYADVQALIQRELVDAQEIREVKTGVGYKALAVDLTLLSDAMRRKWEVIQSRTAVQVDELLHAQQLATGLLRVVGEREQAPAVVADAAANRSRAFALFIRAYDEVRRAVTYLRWREGDADLIAPSLYAGRAAPKRKGEPEVPVDPAAGAPAAGAASTAAGAAGAAAAPEGAVSGTAPHAAAAPSAPVGSPNSEAFTRN